jgi:hypothetical protein
MARSVLKRLKETTLASFFDLASSWGINDQYVYNSTAGTITFNNGSIIILKDIASTPSDPDFDSLGSLEICGGFIDEVAEIEKKAKDVLLTRCRYKLDIFGITPKLFMSCNPTHNFAYSEYYKPNLLGTITKDKVFIQALAADNKHIPESYIQSLEQADENIKQRLLYGNWDYSDDPYVIIPYEVATDTFHNVPQKSGKFYLTADIALEGADLMVVYLWNGLHLVDYLVKEKCSGPQAVQLLKLLANQYDVPQNRICYDGDGIGNYIKGYLPKAYAFHGNAKVLCKGNAANLRSQCFLRLAELMQHGKVSFGIDGAGADELASELPHIKRMADAPKPTIISKKDIKKTLGRSTDYSDPAMMRMVWTIKPQSKATNNKRL